MNIEDLLTVLIIPIIIIGTLIFAGLKPYFEAKSFNECTGGNASYMTALTTELRVENCKK